jgi:two-component system, LytTR family, response regulator
MRVVIVDDEELARRGLRARLERAGVSIVGECFNGADALPMIQKLAPDLVFLDIQMPEMSGLQVAAALNADMPPHVIFVTAFDDYAVQAFEVHAIDYLLKPIDDERLTAALVHAGDAVRTAHDGEFGRRVTRAMAAVNAARPGANGGFMPDRILVPMGGSIVVVRVADIDWIEASGDYVSLHVGKKTWLVREALTAIAQRYAVNGIARIHRSTLVNLDRVTELRPLPNGEFTLILCDGTALKMSRSYRDALEALAGSRM